MKTKCEYCGKFSNENLEMNLEYDDNLNPCSSTVIVCDDCYYEHFSTTCNMCEDSFETPELPGGRFIYLNEEDVGVQTGFYKVKQFPIFIGEMLGEGLFLAENVELVKALVLEEQSSGYICKRCFAKHTQ